jgi:hypothetical protein
MPPVGFEPTISASERPQTYALDGAATGTGAHALFLYCYTKVLVNFISGVLPAIWFCYEVLYAQMLNCFFSLSFY